MRLERESWVSLWTALLACNFLRWVPTRSVFHIKHDLTSSLGFPMNSALSLGWRQWHSLPSSMDSFQILKYSWPFDSNNSFQLLSYLSLKSNSCPLGKMIASTISISWEFFLNALILKSFMYNHFCISPIFHVICFYQWEIKVHGWRWNQKLKAAFVWVRQVIASGHASLCLASATTDWRE